MATRNGADGPSNLKSSENLILVCAAAGPASNIAAIVAATRPATPCPSLPCIVISTPLDRGGLQCPRLSGLIVLILCSAKNMPNERASATGPRAATFPPYEHDRCTTKGQHAAALGRVRAGRSGGTRPC